MLQILQIDDSETLLQNNPSDFKYRFRNRGPIFVYNLDLVLSLTFFLLIICLLSGCFIIHLIMENCRYIDFLCHYHCTSLMLYAPNWTLVHLWSVKPQTNIYYRYCQDCVALMTCRFYINFVYVRHSSYLQGKLLVTLAYENQYPLIKMKIMP